VKGVFAGARGVSGGRNVDDRNLWLAHTIRLPNGLLLIFSELIFDQYWQRKLPFCFHSNKSAGGGNSNEQRIGFERQNAILLARVDRAGENP
jgi:hypothetical protein